MCKYNAELLDKKKSSSISPVLIKWGYKARLVLNEEEAATIIKNQFTPEIITQAINEGGISPKQLLSETELGKQAYNFATHKKKNGTTFLEATINEIDPTIEIKHGRKLYDILSEKNFPKQYIFNLLENMLFEGYAFTKEEIAKVKGLLPQIEREYKGLSIKEFASTILSEKYPVNGILFNDNNELEEHNTTKLDKSSSQLIPIISERQLKLALTIAREFDPKFHYITELKEFFPNIGEIYGNHNGEHKHLKLNSGEYADLRVKGEKDILIEVKTGKRNSTMLESLMIPKYKHVNWVDGTIDSKIALLNFNGSKKHIKLLENYNWKIMTHDKFERIYNKALDLLDKNIPDLTEKSTVPINTKDLKSLDNMIRDSPAVLRRPTARLLRRWSADAIRKLTTQVSKGVYSTVRKPKKEIYQFSFSDFPEYPTIKPSEIEGSVFVDIETAGLRDKAIGTSLITIAAAYAFGDQLISEVYFVQNPLREKAALEWIFELTNKFDNIVTFNGTTFDIPVLQQRAIANLIKPELPNHIDLYYPYSTYARSIKKLSEARLQSFEKFELGIYRENDLSGSNIPPTYLAYINGEREGRIDGIIKHNACDVIATAVLKTYLDSKGVLKTG